MLKRFKNRSLVVTSSILITAILAGLVTVVSLFIFHQRQDDFYEKFSLIGDVLSQQILLNHDPIQQSLQQLKASNVTSSEQLTQIQKQLQSMVGTVSIANAYLFDPNLIKRDGTNFLEILQANQELIDNNIKSGTDYPISSDLVDAVNLMYQTGTAISKPYTDEAGTWITYLHMLKDNQGRPFVIFALDLNAGKVQQDQHKLLVYVIGAGALVTVILVLLIIILLRRSLRPLQQLASISQLAAKGDLTMNLQMKTNNEIGRTATAFNDMVGSLRHLITGIQSTSTNVIRSASDLQAGAEKTTMASQQITQSMSNVSDGANLQNQATHECQLSINEMAVGIQRIAESTQTVAELASDTTRRANQGETEIALLVENMQSMERNMSGTVEVLNELTQFSSSIQGIMAFINEIAEQTNLLALNASIEAARAGDAGKGFAVVAQEIHKLAGHSKDSSQQIDTILKGIMAHAEKAVASIEESVGIAKHGAHTSTTAADTFRTIVTAVDHVSVHIQDLSAVSEQMSASSEQIAASLIQLSSSASQSLDNANLARSASEEQLTLMQHVSGLSQQLKDLAEELNNVIQRFRV